jgi:hypothetical protein
MPKYGTLRASSITGGSAITINGRELFIKRQFGSLVTGPAVLIAVSVHTRCSIKTSDHISAAIPSFNYILPALPVLPVQGRNTCRTVPSRLRSCTVYGFYCVLFNTVTAVQLYGRPVILDGVHPYKHEKKGKGEALRSGYM